MERPAFGGSHEPTKRPRCPSPMIQYRRAGTIVDDPVVAALRPQIAGNGTAHAFEASRGCWLRARHTRASPLGQGGFILGLCELPILCTSGRLGRQLGVDLRELELGLRFRQRLPVLLLGDHKPRLKADRGQIGAPHFTEASLGRIVTSRPFDMGLEGLLPADVASGFNFVGDLIRDSHAPLRAKARTTTVPSSAPRPASPTSRDGWTDQTSRFALRGRTLLEWIGIQMASGDGAGV